MAGDDNERVESKAGFKIKGRGNDKFSLCLKEGLNIFTM